MRASLNVDSIKLFRSPMSYFCFLLFEFFRSPLFCLFWSPIEEDEPSGSNAQTAASMEPKNAKFSGDVSAYPPRGYGDIFLRKVLAILRECGIIGA